MSCRGRAFASGSTCSPFHLLVTVIKYEWNVCTHASALGHLWWMCTLFNKQVFGACGSLSPIGPFSCYSPTFLSRRVLLSKHAVDQWRSVCRWHCATGSHLLAAVQTREGQVCLKAPAWGAELAQLLLLILSLQATHWDNKHTQLSLQQTSISCQKRFGCTASLTIPGSPVIDCFSL